jgi:hypothetical protein
MTALAGLMKHIKNWADDDGALHSGVATSF